jgi:hypothetical protein
MKIERALSIDALERKKYRLMEFESPFAESFGQLVERGGSWIIYGDSGNGKTTGSIQLAKYLTKFGKVLYDSLEERGGRYSLQLAVKRQSFTSVERRKITIVKDQLPTLILRLRQPKSAEFVFIDSLQYSMITKKQYLALVDEFPNKTFIWMSHVDGNLPAGSVASWVYYAADLKIHVKGFKMFIKGRYGGQEDYIIDQKLSDRYWNTL